MDAEEVKAWLARDKNKKKEVFTGELAPITVTAKRPTERILRDSRGRAVGRMKRVGGTDRAPR